MARGAMRTWLSRMTPPLMTIGALTCLWELGVRSAGLPSHLFPPPAMVAARLAHGLGWGGDMWSQLTQTLAATVFGFGVGCAAALVCAVVFFEAQWLRRLLHLVVVAIQSVPKVALAPLMLIWLGYGLPSKVALIALTCFFPVFTAVGMALYAVPREQRDLMRVVGAGRLHRLWHLDLPAVAGPLLTSMQTAFGFALLGCVVMEFLLGTEGAGYLIDSSASTLDAVTAVATMLCLGVLGGLGSLGLRALREQLVLWDRGVWVDPRRRH